MVKTNALRILDGKKISYNIYTYGDGITALSGTEVAILINIDCKRLFKTLVTVGKTGAHYVFMIPVEEELDLKKASIFAKEKSIEMLKSKDLLPLTGYVHGGCSPIGMKKQFPTFIHESAKDYTGIVFSAGKIGIQAELSPNSLEKVIKIEFANLIK